MIDVSIVIVNYNTFSLTCDCITSIYRLTKDVTYEIILVDNGSQERNPSDFKERFPLIKLLASHKNLGFAGGNNLGIEHATGDYILLLNSDTVLKNNAVFFAFERIKCDSSVGAIACKLLYQSGEAQPVAGRFPSLRRELRDLLRLNKGLTREQRSVLYLGTEWDYTKDTEVDWIWGAFFMFPKRILLMLENHKLPADYFMYMEDVLWCFKIRQLGFKIEYFARGEVYHLMRGSSEGIAPVDEFARYALKILPNEYDFIKRNLGWLYAKCYYLVKSLNHLSQRSANDLVKSKTFFSFVLKS